MIYYRYVLLARRTSITLYPMESTVLLLRGDAPTYLSEGTPLLASFYIETNDPFHPIHTFYWQTTVREQVLRAF